jgi:hypothetical protein
MTNVGTEIVGSTSRMSVSISTRRNQAAAPGLAARRSWFTCQSSNSGSPARLGKYLRGGAHRAGVVHDRAVVHAGLEARQVPGPVGETRSALVDQDQPGEGREPLAELDEDGLLPRPHQVDHERHEHQIDRPLAHDLVGDADIGGARVAHLGCFQVHGAEA